MKKLHLSERVEREMGRWTEAAVIAQPVKPKDLKGPRTLVRRNLEEMAGPGDEAVFCLPGFPVIELFAGIGGFSLGLERTGFTTVCQHEMDNNACGTLMANRPRFFRHSALIQGDINTTPTSMILGEAGMRVGETYIVCGGPPCQGFSTAGRRDPKDPRNNLVFSYLQKVREIQPRFFIMENVPGMLSMKRGQVLRDFLKQAHDGYYELVYGLVNACEYGVPQMRCRLIVMGTRRDLAECDGILGSLPKPSAFSHPDLAYIDRMARGPLFANELDLFTHAPGIRYFPDREVLIPPAPTRGGESAGRSRGFVEFYRRLQREEPDRIVLEPRGGDPPMALEEFMGIEGEAAA